jgi:hypothetical protein
MSSLGQPTCKSRFEQSVQIFVIIISGSVEVYNMHPIGVKLTASMV